MRQGNKSETPAKQVKWRLQIRQCLQKCSALALGDEIAAKELCSLKYRTSSNHQWDLKRKSNQTTKNSTKKKIQKPKKKNCKCRCIHKTQTILFKLCVNYAQIHNIIVIQSVQFFWILLCSLFSFNIPQNHGYSIEIEKSQSLHSAPEQTKFHKAFPKMHTLRELEIQLVSIIQSKKCSFKQSTTVDFKNAKLK